MSGIKASNFVFRDRFDVLFKEYNSEINNIITTQCISIKVEDDIISIQRVVRDSTSDLRGYKGNILITIFNSSNEVLFNYEYRIEPYTDNFNLHISDEKGSMPLYITSKFKIIR